MTAGDIAHVLREASGLDGEALGAETVRDAAARHAARAGLAPAEFAARVASDPALRARFVADLLVHETSFFRYPVSFEHLAAFAVRRAAERPGPVRILTAACATGEEPASVVMALLEAGLEPGRILVDAVDLSPAAVERAREGRYEPREWRGLSPERRARFGREEDGVWIVREEVRAPIRYAAADVVFGALPFDGTPHDAILCRNLLIYLVPEARDRLLARLRAALAPDGLLYVGHAEVLVARAAGWRPIDAPGAYVCSAAQAPETVVLAPPVPRFVAAPRAASPARAAPPPVARPPRATAAKAGSLDVARSHADAGRLDEAIAILEDDLGRGRRTAAHYALLAAVLRAAGRPRDEEAALVRALYLDPNHVEALWLAASAAEERGDVAGAERLRARARARVEAETP